MRNIDLASSWNKISFIIIIIIVMYIRYFQVIKFFMNFNNIKLRVNNNHSLRNVLKREYWF